MGNIVLYNTRSREELRKKLMSEEFRRLTVSFYRYVEIGDPQQFRDTLYREWADTDCLGRVYIAREGINAQMSVPEHHYEKFLEQLRAHQDLANIPVRCALEDDGRSFYKLTVKIRPKIVADGLDENEGDILNAGPHLTPLEFHALAGKPGTVVVDMRNHYESEIGHFRGALCPDADTFREGLLMIKEMLKDKKERKILLYCTGGIRCEKASAYLRHHGFPDVNQLYGGILEYAAEIKEHGLESHFTGKNFVFDNRLGERITGEIHGHCQQCGKSCDHHSNCANDDCHLLFIQCPECRDHYEGCCSRKCRDILHMESNTRKEYRQLYHQKYSESRIFKSKLRKSENLRLKAGMKDQFLTSGS